VALSTGSPKSNNKKGFKSMFSLGAGSLTGNMGTLKGKFGFNTPKKEKEALTEEIIEKEEEAKLF
jgi:hypothetical protein